MTPPKGSFVPSPKDIATHRLRTAGLEAHAPDQPVLDLLSPTSTLLILQGHLVSSLSPSSEAEPVFSSASVTVPGAQDSSLTCYSQLSTMQSSPLPDGLPSDTCQSSIPSLIQLHRQHHYLRFPQEVLCLVSPTGHVCLPPPQALMSPLVLSGGPPPS